MKTVIMLLSMLVAVHGYVSWSITDEQHAAEESVSTGSMYVTSSDPQQ